MTRTYNSQGLTFLRCNLSSIRESWNPTVNHLTIVHLDPPGLSTKTDWVSKTSSPLSPSFSNTKRLRTDQDGDDNITIRSGSHPDLEPRKEPFYLTTISVAYKRSTKDVRSVIGLMKFTD